MTKLRTGKRGSGKTNTAKRIVEQLVHAGVPTSTKTSARAADALFLEERVA